LGGESRRSEESKKDAKKDAKKDSKKDDKAAAGPGSGQLLHEGWLKISSMDLMDFGKYPGVPEENGNVQGINVD